MNKARIIIPTNRPDFLNEICKFYKNEHINITVIHTFKLKNKRKRINNIKFIYYKDTLAKRLIFVLKQTKEKYVCIMADDDFVFSKSIYNSINFLKKNKNYIAAQGLHHRFEVKKKSIKFLPSAIKAMMINKEESNNSNLRIFHAFTTRFIDKFYIVMEKKYLINICLTCLPIEKYSRVLLEYYWIICCAILGKSKILNNIYCLRREHSKNDTKISTEIGLDKAISDKKFFSILNKCLNNFYKKNKNKNKINIILLKITLMIFRIKIIIKGKFRLVRFLSDKLRSVKEQKLEKQYKLIEKEEKNKLNLVKKICLV